MNPATQRQPCRLNPMRRMRGFTLVEVMIVVVIVGILASVAYPSYRGQMRRTHRAEGKAVLLDTAQQLERCFTRFNSYNNAGCTIAATINTGAGVASANDRYLLKAAGGNLTATTFTMTATAQGAQATDTACGNLTLTHTGVRGATGSEAATCW